MSTRTVALFTAPPQLSTTRASIGRANDSAVVAPLANVSPTTSIACGEQAVTPTRLRLGGGVTTNITGMSWASPVANDAVSWARYMPGVRPDGFTVTCARFPAPLFTVTLSQPLVRDVGWKFGSPPP